MPTLRRCFFRLLFYFTPSICWFIGLLPSFLFFVKVPFVAISHLILPPLTFFNFLFSLSDASTPATPVRRSILLFRIFHSALLLFSKFSYLQSLGHLVAFQALASKWEGIIAFHTLLSFIFSPYPYGPCADTRQNTSCALGYSPCLF